MEVFPGKPRFLLDVIELFHWLFNLIKAFASFNKQKNSKKNMNLSTIPESFPGTLRRRKQRCLFQHPLLPVWLLGVSPLVVQPNEGS